MSANYPGTAIRSIRVADEIWQAARARAERDGTTITAEVVAFLQAYGSQPVPARSERIKP